MKPEVRALGGSGTRNRLEKRLGQIAAAGRRFRGVRSRAMFVKTTARKTKSGTVRYLHLAHSEWDPVAGRSIPKILYGFGREDQLDRDAIKRLVGSLTRLLDPADALAASASADTGGEELTFCESRPF